MNKGWVKIHRQIQENEYYFSETFTKIMAWVDLIIIANASKGSFFKRGIRVEIERGQVGMDVENIAIRWKWSRGKVERYLKMLENSGQIVRQKNNVSTLISIVNYDSFQNNGNPNNKTISKPNEQQAVNQTNTNKNDKESNKNKKKDKEGPPAEVEFLNYCKGLLKENYGAYDFSLRAKYKSWVEQGWVDGNGNAIKNWKTKIQNTIPHLGRMQANTNNFVSQPAILIKNLDVLVNYIICNKKYPPEKVDWAYIFINDTRVTCALVTDEGWPKNAIDNLGFEKAIRQYVKEKTGI